LDDITTYLSDHVLLVAIVAVVLAIVALAGLGTAAVGIDRDRKETARRLDGLEGRIRTLEDRE